MSTRVAFALGVIVGTLARSGGDLIGWYLANRHTTHLA